MAPRRTAAARELQPSVRCGIYTRKSTDSGLDRHFSSLDNQRQRAEDFAASQADQGWRVVPDRYDDGGFSGGTIERPALRQLLADVEARRLDVIIVYRLDRVSRSLADFVKIHSFLEELGVALVSVTESINTQTPHGRMMVNVLLSFAQYERELAAERTRHKIEAARKRGQWTGGTPSLGYDIAPEGGRLLVNKAEAEQVRAIFELYIEAPSLVRVAEELNRRGWRNKSWTTRGGNRHGGGSWNRPNLRRLLTSPIYIGRMPLGDDSFPGEHKGIVPKKLFDKVQRLMEKNRLTGGAGARNRHGFLLRGILRCRACNAAMVPHPTKSHGRLYRYYTCRAAQKNGHRTCETKTLPADKIERFVVDQIRCIGSDPTLQEAAFRQAVAEVSARSRGLRLEAKRLVEELTRAREEATRLVSAISCVDGPAADAVANELTKAQERVRTIESRQKEIVAELANLRCQTIDRNELDRALRAFDPIWDVLLTPERERILHLIIEKIDYHGGTKKLEISWQLAGFGQLAQEIGP